MAGTLVSVEFTIYGKVQQVFFRKCTQEKAVSLGLVGWCKNEPNKTVIGVIQGDSENITKMKTWLQTEGSPASRIDKCIFTKEDSIPEVKFKEFSIIRKSKSKK